MRRPKKSDRYRKQRAIINSGDSESKEYRQKKQKLDDTVNEARKNALRKITGYKERRESKYSANNILKRVDTEQKRLEIMSKKRALAVEHEQQRLEMSKKKTLVPENNIPRIPQEPEKVASDPDPEQTVTLDQIISKTKITRRSFKRYHGFGLLPQNLGPNIWPQKTIEVVKRIIGYEKQGINVKEIRRRMYPKTPKSSSIKKLRSVVEPCWQSERVLNSKRQKYDDTYGTGEYDFLKTIRIFDALKYPIKDTLRDVVLHIPIRLNITGSGHGKYRESDIDSLEKNLKIFEYHEGFEGELVISVNGFVDKEMIPDVKYLKEIHGTKVGPFHTIVFQRPNTGYQWGGFYDVWLKYKNINCNYFATLECDCWLMSDWYSKCEKEIKKHGYVGQPPKRDMGGQTDDYFYVPRLWKNGNDNDVPHGTDYRKIMTHTRGGFYFCKKEMLKKLDKIYGCFTHSISNDLNIDGVAMGEIGFASKVNQVGYSFIPLEEVAFCSENIGWPKGLKS